MINDEKSVSTMNEAEEMMTLQDLYDVIKMCLEE